MITSRLYLDALEVVKLYVKQLEEERNSKRIKVVDFAEMDVVKCHKRLYNALQFQLQRQSGKIPPSPFRDNAHLPEYLDELRRKHIRNLRNSGRKTETLFDDIMWEHFNEIYNTL